METVELPNHVFPAPCTIMLAGMTGSGKSTLCFEILKYRQELFSQPVKGVIYCYSEYQDIFKNPPGGSDVLFHYGIPTSDELERYIERFEGEHFLFIMDDLMTEMAKSSLGQDMYTKMSHHRNFSCLNIVQNVFVQGKAARNQALNSQFFILTRTCRDVKQISILGSQLFPGKSAQFVQVYQDAVDNPFNPNAVPHLMIACHPFKTKRGCQLMSNLFPPDAPRVLYRLD